MNSKKLFLASAILMALGATSCGTPAASSAPASAEPTTSEKAPEASSEAPTPSSEAPAPSSEAPLESSSEAPKPVTPSISRNIPKEIVLDSEVDMDEYVTISTGAPYTLEVKSGNVSVDGHIVKADGYGPFNVLVVCGTKKKAYAGAVISEQKAKVNSVIEQLEANFLVDVEGPNGKVGTFTKTNYAWFYDYNELGSAGMAKLSDGHWWEFNWDSETQSATFTSSAYSPNGEYYFGGMAFNLLATQLVEMFDAEGEPIVDEYDDPIIRLDPTYSPFYDSSDDNSIYLIEILTGGYVEDMDGAFDTVIAQYVEPDAQGAGEALRFVGAKSQADGTVAPTKWALTIHDWGKAEVLDIKTKIEEGYIPEKMSDEEIVAKFAAINEAKNMTVTIKGCFTDDKGVPLEEEQTYSDGTPASQGGFWNYDGIAKVTADGLDYKNNADGGFFKIGKNPADPNSPQYMYSLGRGEEKASVTAFEEPVNAYEDFYGFIYWTEEVIHNINIKGLADTTKYYVGHTKELYQGVSKIYEIFFGAEENARKTSSGATIDLPLYNLANLLDGRYSLGSVWGQYATNIGDVGLIFYENGDVGFEFGLTWTTGVYFTCFMTVSNIGTTVLDADYMADAEFPEPEAPATSEEPTGSVEPEVSEPAGSEEPVTSGQPE